MQMKKRIRLVTTLVAVAGFAVTAALIMAGCDDDSTTFPIQHVAPTGPESHGPAKRTTTGPIVNAKEEPNPNLFHQFEDETGPVTVDMNAAKVIQTLAIFNHPDSCCVTADGKNLFVTNSGVVVSGILGPSVQYNNGAISKLSIDADGRLKLVSLKFIDNLHAPMGIAVLPKATAKFPAGSLFVSTGMTAGLDEMGDHITDITRFNPGVSIFNPETGKQLGFIPMGPGRAVAKELTHPVLAPCGLCFDGDGNLYITDTGNTGKDLEPSIRGWPGVLRISNKHIDQYSDNKFDEKDRAPIAYTYAPREPAGIFYSSYDDALYWTTSDGKQPVVGGVYRVPRDNFSHESQTENILGGVEAPILGVVITPNKNLIASQIDGKLTIMLSGQKILSEVEFNQSGTFSTPADIKIHTSFNKFNILYIPEQDPNSDEAWKQRLRVIVLPKAL